MADGPEENGMEFSEFGQDRIGQNLSGLEVSVPSQVVGGEGHFEIFLLHDSLQDFEAFVDDFRAGTVSGDDRDLVAINPPLPISDCRLLIFKSFKADDLAKSLFDRHPGESRGPENLKIPGFRLSPE
jgi:hypothetical protein